MDLENLKQRCQTKLNCEQDQNAQAAVILLCKKDIQYFFKYWLWTFDPRKSPSDLQFIPYDYQIKFIDNLNKDIANGQSSLTEKSRDMGVTWMVLGVFLYRWLFFDENFLMGSKVEESVDKIGDIKSLFERLRYMLSKLPDWMVDRCEWKRQNSAYMRIYKETGPSITGESMNSNFSRQGRYTAILLDEFSFVDSPATIWRACGDSAPAKFPVSTPNGHHNFFATLRDSGKIKVNTLHWSMHPEKDQIWYEKQKADRSDKDVAQELDINYNISAGDPFYNGFSRALHLRRMRISQERELILGWDYGFRHPNCSIHQISVEGIWIIVDNIFGEDQTIDEFAEEVEEYLNEKYAGYLLGRNFGDPAGRQSSDKSRKSSEKILHQMGFPVVSIPSNSPHSNYDARKRIIEKRLRSLIGGIPSLVINDVPGNKMFVEAFEGGYKTPDANKYGGIDEKPVRDGWYEHNMNSLEYVAINLFRKIDFQPKKRTLVASGLPVTLRNKLEKRELINAGMGQDY